MFFVQLVVGFLYFVFVLGYYLLYCLMFFFFIKYYDKFFKIRDRKKFVFFSEYVCFFLKDNENNEIYYKK